MPEDGTTTQRGALTNAQMPDDREIELKLLTDTDTLERLLQAPVIARNARSKGTVRRLEAVYYDTPDVALARRGASLRVRRSGRQRIQTLKLAPEASPLQRRELESHVPDMMPRFDLLPMGELGAPFDALQVSDIVPVFTTRIRRHLITVEFGGAVIEAAFDEGTLIAGERTEDVCELELELKSGEVGILYELALALLEAGPLRIGSQSKAERGHALAFDTVPVAEKAASTGIGPHDTVDEVIAKALASCQRHMMANLTAAQSGQDPGGVHQMRVALRRLRTAISLFRREVPASSLLALSAEARRLARALGPARNWDVFATSTVAEIESANLPGVDFAGITAAIAPFRMRSQQAAYAALTGLDCTRFLLSLGRTIERRSWRNDIGTDALAVLTRPAGEFADRALARLQRRALKRGHHFRHLQPDARHALRLTLKKLRYGAEFFMPLYADGAAAGKYLKRLSRLQDVLGTDNDVTTTQPLLREVEESTISPEIHRAIGAIIGWQGRDRIEAAEALRRTWRRFVSATPFWAE